MKRFLRPLLAGLVAAAQGACSYSGFQYTTERYGQSRSGPQMITLGCRDSYEVWDRAASYSLLVVTNVFNETLVSCVDGGPSLPVRQRQVAEVYLVERLKRPGCRITGDTELGAFHREFTYVCDANPAGPRVPTAPARS